MIFPPERILRGEHDGIDFWGLDGHDLRLLRAAIVVATKVKVCPFPLEGSDLFVCAQSTWRKVPLTKLVVCALRMGEVVRISGAYGGSRLKEGFTVRPET